MTRVLAVNNYPSDERFARLVGALEANGVQVSKRRWSESSARLFNSFEGVVLSGSPDMLSQEGVQRKFGAEMEAILETRVPLLGICFGHQLVGRAFGSEVVSGRRVLKYVETDLLVRDRLFDGLRGKALVLESHSEVIDRLPDRFSLLARSPSSAVAAMKHRRLQLYGLQFHPERTSRAKPDGNTILSNFVKGLS